MELKMVPMWQKYYQVSKMSKKLKIGPKFIILQKILILNWTAYPGGQKTSIVL